MDTFDEFTSSRNRNNNFDVHFSDNHSEYLSKLLSDLCFALVRFNETYQKLNNEKIISQTICALDNIHKNDSKIYFYLIDFLNQKQMKLMFISMYNIYKYVEVNKKDLDLFMITKILANLTNKNHTSKHKKSISLYKYIDDDMLNILKDILAMDQTPYSFHYLIILVKHIITCEHLFNSIKEFITLDYITSNCIPKIDINGTYDTLNHIIMIMYDKYVSSCKKSLAIYNIHSQFMEYIAGNDQALCYVFLTSKKILSNKYMKETFFLKYNVYIRDILLNFDNKNKDLVFSAIILCEEFSPENVPLSIDELFDIFFRSKIKDVSTSSSVILFSKLYYVSDLDTLHRHILYIVSNQNSTTQIKKFALSIISGLVNQFINDNRKWELFTVFYDEKVLRYILEIEELFQNVDLLRAIYNLLLYAESFNKFDQVNETLCSNENFFEKIEEMLQSTNSEIASISHNIMKLYSDE